MKIKPYTNHVYLNIDKPTAGMLDTSSKASAVEYAEVLEVGEGVTNIKKGDKMFVKSWAIDIIDHEGKKYHFIDITTGGIKAIVK